MSWYELGLMVVNALLTCWGWAGAWYCGACNGSLKAALCMTRHTIPVPAELGTAAAAAAAVAADTGATEAL